MSNSMSFSLLLLSCMAVPLLFETEFVLKIWLGIVPKYASSFTQILIITCVPNIINAVIVTAVHATGKIKYMSFITGTIFLMNLPILYFWLRIGGAPTSSYISAFIIMILVTISNSIIAKFVIPQLRFLNFCRSLFRSMLIILISAAVSGIFLLLMKAGWVRLILEVISYVLTLIIMTYLIGLDKSEKILIANRVKAF